MRRMTRKLKDILYCMYCTVAKYRRGHDPSTTLVRCQGCASFVTAWLIVLMVNHN